MADFNKQDIAREICKILKIKINEKEFFSTGSTITIKAIKSIYEALTESIPVKLSLNDNTKHGLIRGIAAILGLVPKETWFSIGSTVTTKAFSEIYESIKKRIEIDKYDERELPIYLNFNSMNDFEKEIIKNIISKNDLKKYQSEIKELPNNDNKIIDLIIERIKRNPFFKYISFESGIVEKEQAIIEVKKKTSDTGMQIRKIEKNAIDFSFEFLFNKYFKEGK